MSRLITLLGTATIANGATTSSAIETSDCSITGILIPSAFTGTSITFTAALTSGGTYYPVRQPDSTGALVTIGVTAGTFIPLILGELVGLPFLKIVSGSAEGASRDIQIYGRNAL